MVYNESAGTAVRFDSAGDPAMNDLYLMAVKTEVHA